VHVSTAVRVPLIHLTTPPMSHGRIATTIYDSQREQPAASPRLSTPSAAHTTQVTPFSLVIARAVDAIEPAALRSRTLMCGALLQRGNPLFLWQCENPRFQLGEPPFQPDLQLRNLPPKLGLPC